MSVQLDLLPRCFTSSSSSSSTTSSIITSVSSSSSKSFGSSGGQRTMLRDPPPPLTSSSSAVLRRDSLKLSFNRSISEPHNNNPNNNPPVLSPPSLSPSLHPSKRCRVMGDAILGPPQLPPPQPLYPATISMAPSSLRPPPPGSVSLPSSPCSESSTLQRTLLLQKARTITPNHLASKLTSSPSFLLVDCRPFMAYNVSHIRGAINVNCCDRFNRKRLQQGKATLADLAATKEGKEMLKRRTWKEVVVYDDCSESLDKLPASHTLFLVMNVLVEDQREPVMLQGGLRDFQPAHRSLCEDHLMMSSSSQTTSTMSSSSSSFSSNPLLPDLPSPSTKDIENYPATQVLPFLFLGNMRDASDASVLRALGIRYVLNVTAKPPDYVLEPDLVYKQLVAADNGVQNLRQFFEEAFDFVDLARDAGSGVLIHCHAGVSRSPTIAVAYLMKHYPMAMSDAYKFVKSRRSIISPNLNFMGQLWEYEQGLRGDCNGGNNRVKEPLTVEMREVLNSSSSSSSSSSSKIVISHHHHHHQTSFRWSDSTALKQQPKEDDRTSMSGCGV